MAPVRIVVLASLLFVCTAAACLAADLPSALSPDAPPDMPPDAVAAEQLQRQGAFYAALLRQVYDLAGTEDVRGGGAYLVPEQQGLAPVLLAGASSAQGDASVEATLQSAYPFGTEGRTPEKGYDPGRLRNEALLRALYGADAVAVRAACEVVDFFGHKVAFNSRQGAAAALKRVVGRLQVHLAVYPGDMPYLVPPGGTFAWRQVRDTGRLSAHAFGIAIDLSTSRGPYWMWRPAAATVATARAHYPQGIVDAFEAEGFIWGGKWDAFDFMHFEYRPEFRGLSLQEGAGAPISGE